MPHYMRDDQVFAGAIILMSVTGPRIIGVTGSPEGVVSAPVGSFVTRVDSSENASLYVKERSDVGGDTAKGWASVNTTRCTP